MKPLFSVIVPVYNVENYLEKALNSCIQQNYEHYEIIVVNDGTLDHSQEIIDRYVSQYPDIVFSFCKENGGLSDARNFGIKKAKGEYLLFLDGDDFFDENCFADIAKSIEEFKSDILVYNFRTVDEKGKMIATTSLSERKHFSLEDYPDILIDAEVCVWNKAYKRELFDDISFPLHAYYEDMGTTPRLLLRAKDISIYPFFILSYLSVRKGKITGSFSEKSFSILAMCEMTLQDFQAAGKYDKYYPQLKRLCLQEIREQLMTAPKSSNPLKFRFLKECHQFIRKYFRNQKTDKPLPATKFGFIYDSYCLSYLYFWWKGQKG